MAIQRIIHTCKTCKRIWAHDYTIQPYLDRQHRPVLTHINENGYRVTYDYHEVCPAEYEIYKSDGQYPEEPHKVKSSLVVGTLDETKQCDGRCRSAKGPVCNCSCGGSNHGSDHLR